MIFFRSKLLVLGAIGALSILTVVACSDSDSNSNSGTGAPDAAVDPTKDSGNDPPGDDVDSGPIDDVDSGPTDDSGCGEACRETSVVSTFGSVSSTLTQAYYGGDSPEAKKGLHVEISLGDHVGCPTEASPTPKRLLVVEGIPETASAGQSFTLEDGIVVGYFDFVGDQTEKLIIRATSASVTVVDSNPQASPAVFDIDVDLELEEGGTAKGSVRAEHCTSLDKQP